jgi:hypothetical protein
MEFRIIWLEVLHENSNVPFYCHYYFSHFKFHHLISNISTLPSYSYRPHCLLLPCHCHLLLPRYRYSQYQQ